MGLWGWYDRAYSRNSSYFLANWIFWSRTMESNVLAVHSERTWKKKLGMPMDIMEVE